MRVYWTLRLIRIGKTQGVVASGVIFWISRIDNVKSSSARESYSCIIQTVRCPPSIGIKYRNDRIIITRTYGQSILLIQALFVSLRHYITLHIYFVMNSEG